VALASAQLLRGGGAKAPLPIKGAKAPLPNLSKEYKLVINKGHL